MNTYFDVKHDWLNKEIKSIISWHAIQQSSEIRDCHCQNVHSLIGYPYENGILNHIVLGYTSICLFPDECSGQNLLKPLCVQQHIIYDKGVVVKLIVQHNCWYQASVQRFSHYFVTHIYFESKVGCSYDIGNVWNILACHLDLIMTQCCHWFLLLPGANDRLKLDAMLIRTFVTSWGLSSFLLD